MMIGITGVNGFIGSCIYDFLLKSQYDIVGLSTKPKADQIITLLDGVPGKKIKNTKSIIHCGALVGNGFTKEEYQYANVKCTENLLRWCEENQVEQFVFFSTGGVYGDQKEWVDETTYLDPRGHYAESKCLAEEKVLQADIPIKTIIRLYFPIGNFAYQHLFSKVTHDLLNKKEVFLNDQEGHPCISPIDVNDICRIILQLTNKKISGIYNLSANIGITIGEIIDYISTLCEITPQKYIRNVECGNYLGKADKVMLATGYNNFITPKDALHSNVRDFLSVYRGNRA